MYRYEHPHPAVTVDIVIFTVRDEALRLLLVRRAAQPFKGKWALPGGFVHIDEDLEAAARRELEEETGVKSAYLEQLHAFGRPDRDPRERVITVAYYALIPSEKLRVRAATDAEAAGWFALGELPALAFDHAEIVATARARLIAALDRSTIAFALMPGKFTLGQLQEVYEIIRGEALDKRNFRKRILSLGRLEETGEERRDGARRPARLYRVRRRRGKVRVIR